MTSPHGFGEDTQATEVATTFSDRIRGKTILLTGVSPGGLGESTAHAFAAHNPALLILASRTDKNLQAVADSIREKHNDASVKTVVLDLASQKSVRAAAEEVKKLTPRIDILINNAAVSPWEYKTTEDGLELQFGANHVGPFLLTNLLLPLVRAAAQSDGAQAGDVRIVNLSSAGHRLSPVRFHDYNIEGKDVPPEEQPPKSGKGFDPYERTQTGYQRFLAYGQCKTAVILTTLAMQKRLKDAGIAVYAVHPGTISTNLGRNPPKGEKPFPPPEWKTKTLDGGASTTLVAALDPALNEMKGTYLDNCALQEPAAHANNPEVAERLWTLTESLVGETFTMNK